MRTQKGFSLTEVLLAVCTLAVGMIFVAGVFPLGILLSTVATERTISAVVADEAFAKIKLCRINPDSLLVNGHTVFQHADSNMFDYPSTDMPAGKKQYSWSALCRRIGPTTIQITVFVSRKIRAIRPIPVRVKVEQANNDELRILGDKTLINDGHAIIDDETGRLYRVLERYKSPDDIIKLDKPWESGIFEDEVWVIPPPIGSGRCPCIVVYQKVINF